ncbi:hypothetical protein [Mesotoga sp. H07.pep.5.3]|uniref:hypothetical protein n=1 Tax=Mesotoga sp. H07.pep.5.3 TaxID=1421003 RepID=UPI000C18CB23|nr:hypothetical protein [Mesotoga sp. H07.pep.5.3]PIJ62114.1 hypothetical protein V513_05745 [Mesotoga sp. H07.pep.5.3]
MKEQMRKIVFLVIICIAFVAVFSGFGMLKRHNSDFELIESELVTTEYGEIVSLPLSNFVKANGATVEFSLVGENGKIDGDFLVIDSSTLSLPEETIDIIVKSEKSEAVLHITFSVKNLPPPPVLSIANQKVFEGDRLEIDLSELTFSEMNEISYEIVGGPGLIEGDIYRYSSPVREAPVAHRVTIKAIDSLRQWHCETFSIIVIDKNHWPEEPHGPYPGDGIEDFFNDLVLSWECSDPDGDILSYDLYFGTENLGLLAKGINKNTYELPPLEHGETYSWQVVADDGNGGLVKGPIWSFSTEEIPVLTWKRIVGFEGRDSFNTVKSLSSGGYILCGSSDLVSESESLKDSIPRVGWIVKIDNNGFMEWEKRFNLGWVELNDIIATSDDGFLVVGKAIDKTAAGFDADSSLLVIKLDKFANEKWRFKSEGIFNEATSVIEVEDGYLILGTKTESKEDRSILLVKLGKSGSLEWQRSYGGSSFDRGVAFDVDGDGNVVIVAETTSKDGEAKGNLGNRFQVNGIYIELSSVLTIKVSRDGEVIWSKVLGGKSEDSPSSVRINDEGEIIITGSTNSREETFQRDSSDYDGFAAKLSEEGDLLWARTYGGSGNDIIEDFFITQAGGIQAIGFSESNRSINQPVDEAMKRSGITYSDFWVLQTDAEGELLWQKYLGGSKDDVGLSIAYVCDGFVVAGYSASVDGDVGSNKGDFDAAVFYLR